MIEPTLVPAHVALWTRDLARLRRFYEDALGGRVVSTYTNPRTQLSTCFVDFGGGVRIELMTRPDVVPGDGATARDGYAHLAFTAGSREAVDAVVERLGAAGIGLRGAPRVTGDGYYEAVIEDPDGNPIEIVA